jgi:hypothetical protein
MKKIGKLFDAQCVTKIQALALLLRGKFDKAYPFRTVEVKL